MRCYQVEIVQIHAVQGRKQLALAQTRRAEAPTTHQKHANGANLLLLMTGYPACR